MQKIDGKIENPTPYKIVTHEDFNLQPSTRDYVADITHRFRGGFPQIGEIIYNTFVTFLLYYFFFSILRPGQTDAHIITLNGSNDVFLPKDGPVGGQDDG